MIRGGGCSSAFATTIIAYLIGEYLECSEEEYFKNSRRGEGVNEQILMGGLCEYLHLHWARSRQLLRKVVPMK